MTNHDIKYDNFPITALTFNENVLYRKVGKVNNLISGLDSLSVDLTVHL